jgi:hypothetical protein
LLVGVVADDDVDVGQAVCEMTSGPAGSVKVPSVAPRWPIATTASTDFLSFAASAFTASAEFVTWNGSSAPGLMSDRMSSFV